MGIRLSFGIGPLRISIPLTSRRRRRGTKRSRTAQPPAWNYATWQKSTEPARADMERRRVEAIRSPRANQHLGEIDE